MNVDEATLKLSSIDLCKTHGCSSCAPSNIQESHAKWGGDTKTDIQARAQTQTARFVTCIHKQREIVRVRVCVCVCVNVYLDDINGLYDTGSEHAREPSIDKGLGSYPHLTAALRLVGRGHGEAFQETLKMGLREAVTQQRADPQKREREWRSEWKKPVSHVSFHLSLALLSLSALSSKKEGSDKIARNSLS